MDQIRIYEYKCRRCGEIFTEDIGGEAEAIEGMISLIAIPDTQEEVLYKQKFPDAFPKQLLFKSIHHCKDGGWGLGDIVGASPRIEG